MSKEIEITPQHIAKAIEYLLDKNEQLKVELQEANDNIIMKYEHKDGKDFTFLIGKSIIKVEEKQVKDEYSDEVDGYILTCKDGTIIEIAINEGCGGCGNGWSSFNDLKKLEENNNIITNIEVKYTEDGYEDEFTMFVYYEDNTINQLHGDDGYGNGYYGGGFYITIKDIGDKENEKNK